jgi:hypothetical protein
MIFSARYKGSVPEALLFENSMVKKEGELKDRKGHLFSWM